VDIGGAVLQICCGEGEGLRDVLGLKLGIIAEEVYAVWILRYGFDDATHGETHASDAGLAVQLGGVPCDSVERLHSVDFSNIRVFAWNLANFDIFKNA